MEYAHVPVKTTMLSQGKRTLVEVPGAEIFIGLEQPYGAFAKALLEKQNYPNFAMHQAILFHLMT